jgi:membrane-associated PAP2 superfamily phosphatase
MNRTGLVIALAVAVSVGLVLAIRPDFDIWLAGLFFDPNTKRFILQNWILRLRDASIYFVSLFALAPIAAMVLKLFCPTRRMLVPGPAAVFLLASLALAPGIAVNVILKEHWGRSRPIDIPQFAGTERFVAWWDPRGICPKNCSYVSGDVSGGVWLLAPAALTPPTWRPLAYAAAVAFGSFVGLLRMAMGAHFFSDVVFSGVFTFLIIWLVHGLVYRWPATRLSHDAIELAIARSGLHLRKIGTAISVPLCTLFRGSKPRQGPTD